ncbi:hypothetical protein [Mucilaginibacter sp. UR6-11]|uniref:hypothetical protein n=1 Tax=Mucilaginibacter sp. UR6-11 TaxID=1435644 RepID=UPI001E2C14BD|nr:hypothetical protein [Mucilaginibacter sp. UR6-11]MCC8425891.1 hypothetical protein [Mucilaginibacter sp. UR6-11]
MLLIALQIGLILSAILLPLYVKIRRSTQYKIDTDTNDANYAINEHGVLERYKRIRLGNPKQQVKN